MYGIAHGPATASSGVIGELAGAGVALDARWFLPHFEFRFPLWGEVAREVLPPGMSFALDGGLKQDPHLSYFHIISQSVCIACDQSHPHAFLCKYGKLFRLVPR